MTHDRYFPNRYCFQKGDTGIINLNSLILLLDFLIVYTAARLSDQSSTTVKG
jgi:hypothetical protein